MWSVVVMCFVLVRINCLLRQWWWCSLCVTKSCSVVLGDPLAGAVCDALVLIDSAVYVCKSRTLAAHLCHLLLAALKHKTGLSLWWAGGTAT